MLVDFDRILRSKGMTQVELANRLDMHPQNLSRVIKSDDIKLSLVLKIAKAISEPVEYVLGIESEGSVRSMGAPNQSVSMPREVFDQLSKMTETILAQQKTIDTLSRSVEILSKQQGIAEEVCHAASMAVGE